MKAEGQERTDEPIRDGTEKQDGQHGKHDRTGYKTGLRILLILIVQQFPVVIHADHFISFQDPTLQLEKNIGYGKSIANEELSQ